MAPTKVNKYTGKIRKPIDSVNKLNFFEKFIMCKVKGVTTGVYELSEEKINAFAKKIVRVNRL